MFRESLRQCVRQRGDSRWSVQRSRDLALAVMQQGRYVEAANIVLDALRTNPKTVASKEPTVTKYIDLLTGNMHYYAWKLSDQCRAKLNAIPRKHLELARALVKLRPERPNHWRNLGAALYRNGQWSEAVESFQKAGEILKDEDMVPHMFLAMAHWQLGNEELAKEIYAQGRPGSMCGIARTNKYGSAAKPKS